MDLTVNYSPLTTFVELGKNATNLAAAKNIERAVSHKNTFVFGELLSLKNVQDLQGTEYTKYLSFLQLFAYGTYKDYIANVDTLPQLTELQIRKLKKLSIISLAAEVGDVLNYDMLLKELDIPNVRSLEDLVIECIYSNIMEATLDQKEKHVQVHSAIGRDVAPGQLGKMIEKLKNWSHTAETLIKNMDEEIDEEMKKWNEEQEKKIQFEEEFKRAHSLALKEKERNSGGQDGSASMDYYGGGNQFAMDTSNSRRSTGSRGRMGVGRMK
eukprot:g2421.t1